MSDEAEMVDEQLPLEGAGQQLRRAREGEGKTLEQVAAETRIPIRHLEVIEAGDFSALPARTYAIGFSRTYARAVGLNETEIADQVRAELGDTDHRDTQHAARFEPSDPARIPSRGLAWFSAFAALLLIVGGLAFFRGYIFPGSGPASITEPEVLASAEDQGEGDSPAPSIGVRTPPTGAVVFTSQEDGLWVKFYDADGERLMEKQMAEGETYTVPSTAEGPQVWTGQPESLAVSIGGEAIGNLSQDSEILKDVPVSPEALVKRIEDNAAAARAEAEAQSDTDAAADSVQG